MSPPSPPPGRRTPHPPRPGAGLWAVAGAAGPLALALPLAAGLLGVALPAAGFHPGLDRTAFSAGPLRDLLTDPSLPRAILATLVSGLGGAVLSVAAAFAFCAAASQTRWFERLKTPLAAGLALPHASLAVGFAFLVAPSGFLARLVSPQLTGWQSPPDIMIPGDPLGLALLVALALKETLFMVLMIIAAQAQAPTDALARTARSFGYGRVRAWLTAVAPRIYPLVRLPIYAVIAASLGSVDLALVLGPSAPPTLATLILRWSGDFDLALQLRAAAGALLLLALSLGAIGLWSLAARLTARHGRAFLTSGRRTGRLDIAARVLGQGVVGLALGVSLAALALLAAWSFAHQWTWPHAAPQSWTLAHWANAPALAGGPAARTVLIAVLSTAIALALAIACLEARAGGAMRRTDLVMFAPLLAPQAGFLFGVQVLWSALRWDGAPGVVVWTHLLFVLPYVYLSLRDPFLALDPRLAITARALGRSRLDVLLRVKLPLLLRPLLTGAAIGVAVSATLYLPTIGAGAGRVTTLASETIALAAGGDRRTLGVVAVLLAALPFVALACAMALAGAAARRRRGLGA